MHPKDPKRVKKCSCSSASHHRQAAQGREGAERGKLDCFHPAHLKCNKLGEKRENFFRRNCCRGETISNCFAICRSPPRDPRMDVGGFFISLGNAFSCFAPSQLSMNQFAVLAGAKTRRRVGKNGKIATLTHSTAKQLDSLNPR